MNKSRYNNAAVEPEEVAPEVVVMRNAGRTARRRRR